MINLSDYVPTGSGGGGSGGNPNYTISWSAAIASGGETTLTPPYAFTKTMVFINGAAQDETRGAFSIQNNRVLLSSALEAGDEVQLIIGQVLPPGTSEWNLITSNTTAEVNQKILLDSNAGTFTVTLPANPEEGETVDFVDVGDSLDIYNVTLARNSKLIMGATDTLVLDTNLISLTLLYSNASYGWRIIE